MPRTLDEFGLVATDTDVNLCLSRARGGRGEGGRADAPEYLTASSILINRRSGPALLIASPFDSESRLSSVRFPVRRSFTVALLLSLSLARCLWVSGLIPMICRS